jgi:hypothetical protein
MERVKEEVGMGILMNMPKEKLVEELLKARMNEGGGAAEPEFSPPAQERERKASTHHKVDNWATQQQPWTAPPAAPAEPAPATHSHHSHSKQSESKSKGKTEAAKAPSVLTNAWDTAPVEPTGQQGGGGGGFVPNPGANAGAAW